MKLKIKKTSTILLKATLCALIFLSAAAGTLDFMIPPVISRYPWQEPDISGALRVDVSGYSGARDDYGTAAVQAASDMVVAREKAANGVGNGNINGKNVAALSVSEKPAVRKYEATVSLFGAIPLKKVEYSVYDEIMLCPGGMPFGVKLYTDGLIVAGVEPVTSDGAALEPATEAGIRAGDIIVSVDGVRTVSADGFADTVASSGGKTLKLQLKRGGAGYETSVTPVKTDDGGWRIGLWLRDSSAGIGTVTFVDPTTGEFAGLGHGICDADTGSVMPLSRGVVVDVDIGGITKGVPGTPGELVGSFRAGKTGALIGNTASGVFGVFSEPPLYNEAVPIALSGEVKEGAAEILCTLDGGGVRRYDVIIESISRGDGFIGSAAAKNFTVRVTDPSLLSLTGGIVQGMSGSPVLQNGKLVGALTHVLIGDPAAGYGIFIENMLAASENLR